MLSIYTQDEIRRVASIVKVDAVSLAAFYACDVSEIEELIKDVPRAHRQTVARSHRKDGYVVVPAPDWYTGPVSQSRRVFEHRVRMCELLNVTQLPANTVVHHIDGNKSNNELSNLLLMTASAHSRLHQQEKRTERNKLHNLRPLRHTQKICQLYAPVIN